VVSRWWRSRWGRWLPLLSWMGAIFIMSNQPKTNIPSFGVWDLLVKKGSHFLAYGVLASLALRVTDGEGRKRPYLWALLLTILYAISDEFHQTFIPGRNGMLMDVFIDSLGGLTALFSWRKNWLRLPGFQRQSTPSP
jgi:VanZ family protein